MLWTLGEYGYNWAASIDEIPEDERYTEDGDINVPDEWKGHKVLGIADGEYIETDELVENGNSVQFDFASLSKAIDFAKEFEWDRLPGYQSAMQRIESMMK
jgi:hypothetical protein